MLGQFKCLKSRYVYHYGSAKIVSRQAGFRVGNDCMRVRFFTCVICTAGKIHAKWIRRTIHLWLSGQLFWLFADYVPISSQTRRKDIYQKVMCLFKRLT